MSVTGSSEIPVIDLEPPPSSEDTPSKTRDREAEEKKELGNELYKRQDYKNALTYYSEAIALCPGTASFYGNRSACYVMLGLYNQALVDAKMSVTLDPKFTKGYIRIAKCHLALGDLIGLEQILQHVNDLGETDSVKTEILSLKEVKQLEAQAQSFYESGDYRRVVFLMDRCLAYCIASCRYKLMKSECLAFLGRCQESQEIANDICRVDNNNADAICIRGMCLYYMDNVDQALKHFQHVLKIAPDHSKAMDLYKKVKLLRQKKEEGNEAFKAGKWEDAYNLYTDALTIDSCNKTVNAKLYFNKATVCSKLNKLNDAVECCTEALKLDESYLKALLRRAKCYADLEKHQDAVNDYQKAYNMDKSYANKKLLSDANHALKLSKRKDYYKILGVNKNATEYEIKKAYRKRALDLHPDRHVGASEADRLDQERKFKELGEAYGVLSDPKKKTPYDSGQDLDGQDFDIDPNKIFKTFFCDGFGPVGSDFGGFRFA